MILQHRPRSIVTAERRQILHPIYQLPQPFHHATGTILQVTNGSTASCIPTTTTNRKTAPNRSESDRSNPKSVSGGRSRPWDAGREGRLPGLDASAPAARRRIPERRPRLSAIAIAFTFVFSTGVAAAAGGMVWWARGGG
jgi:hypothetical protein